MVLARLANGESTVKELAEPFGDGRGFLEVDGPRKLVATERFGDAWYPGDAVGDGARDGGGV